MDVVELSRFQFASTSIFHFFFVSLTVGLAFLIAVMETIAYVRADRREVYEKMTNFFGHLFSSTSPWASSPGSSRSSSSG